MLKVTDRVTVAEVENSESVIKEQQKQIRMLKMDNKVYRKLNEQQALYIRNLEAVARKLADL